MRSNKVSFFERLARRCAERPWHVIIIWVMLFAVGATLFATLFTRNTTTVTRFTTDTDSKKADDLFEERFHQAAYKVENAVITSNTYTADDPEFWAYVDGLYARLKPLMDEEVVKSVQYYDPALREGLPLMPAMLQQMVDAIELVLDEESTDEELAQAANSLQTSAARIREVAQDLTPDLTADGAEAKDGMLRAAGGADELSGSLLIAVALQTLHEALEPIAAGASVSHDALISTVKLLQDSASSLRNAVAYMEEFGPGTPDRPALISGLRDTASGLEEVAGLYWLRDGTTKTYNALEPMARGEYLTVESYEATATLLWNSAPELRAAATKLESTGPGTPDRPALVSGLRQAAAGLEELAGVYELKMTTQKGLAFAQMMTPSPLPTADKVNPAVDDMPITVARLRHTVDRLVATGPGTSSRPELIDGLNQAADELEANTPNAEMLRGLVNGRPLTDPILWIALVAASPTIQNQIDTAEAGLGQIQRQCADNIGQTEAGLAQITSQCSDQIGSAKAGLTQMRTQFTQQLPTAMAGVEEAVSGDLQARGLVSADKRTALFAINMSEDADEAAKHITELRKVVLTGNGVGTGPDTFENGFRVRMVGNTNVSRDMQDVALSDLRVSLSYAVPIALIILILVFGSLAAAMLPLLLSIMSIIVALGIAAVVGIWIPLTFAIENIVFMLGLTLGIDHALFVAYRYREERRKGRDKMDAIAESGATAGHAIFYAGLIVVIALWGIFMIPCNMHKSLALGAIIVVAAIAPASMTLLPAVLSLMSNRFDWVRLPWQKRITDLEQPKTDEERGFWHLVTSPARKAPVASLLLCSGLIIACITPMLHMRLSYSYVDALPQGCISRSGYDAMMEAGYPNSLVAPLDIAIDGYDKPEVKAQTDAFIRRLDEDGGFITAVPMEVNDTGDVAWKRVFLNQDPFTAEASDKVKQLRTEFIGDSFAEAGGEAMVTGYGAFNNDFVSVTQQYMTPVLVFVLGLSFLLMLVAFRSILLAVVCTIFNLLSVYAAYGMVVFVFQDGHSGGFYREIPGIDAYVPIFLLCGLFGISMDYFVFLLSRIRESYDETGNMSEAIMYAFRRTGLVVLGAAAIMLVVFFAFSFSQIVIVAEFGVGLCVAVLIDATLITLVMSPATMKLLGKWFWWWPRWLKWVPDLRAKPAQQTTETDGAGRAAPGAGFNSFGVYVDDSRPLPGDPREKLSR